MIAIISSTLIPYAPSYFTNQERLEQTIHTINKLSEKGFKQIFLFDNSVNEINMDWIQSRTKQDINIFYARQYGFENKGLNEALLILNNLHRIPEDEYVFKISGRYYPNEAFNISEMIEKITDKEILGYCINMDADFPFFSTRSYLVKNKKALESILKLAVEEMIGYGRSCNSIRNLVSLMKSIFYKNIVVGTPFTLSLEQSFGRILKFKKNYQLAESMNIEGFVAGSDKLDFISE
ncbi:hypothetical protein [Pedobacter sp. Leaf176]|uniref:hypothetical protein n=1 Tax=Pedobacter sp. Leaf176 TaxID=1736286 RepID=UPI0006FCAEA2|nr:hypothetical protein [Pedobacter sp. Leaf176]KQR72690.1 hypothetical protein ASF92_05295 [Pedobacter sp. Leaf176]